MKNKGFEDLFEMLQRGLQSCVQLTALNQLKMFEEGIDYEYTQGDNFIEISGTKDGEFHKVRLEVEPKKVFVEDLYKMMASAKLLKKFGITLSDSNE